MTEQELRIIIAGCRAKDLKSQRKLFAEMYDFGMSIASRYSTNRMETEEIANDGFYKMLKNIDKYQDKIPFTLWLRRIIINCGIDYYRKYNKLKSTQEYQTSSNLKTVFNQGEQRLDAVYLSNLIQCLSPQYRIVFILYVIEEYTHAEISEKLKISIGTCKSNLSKARTKLKGMIQSLKQNNLER